MIIIIVIRIIIIIIIIVLVIPPFIILIYSLYVKKSVCLMFSGTPCISQHNVNEVMLHV